MQRKQVSPLGSTKRCVLRPGLLAIVCLVFVSCVYHQPADAPVTAPKDLLGNEGVLVTYWQRHTPNPWVKDYWIDCDLLQESDFAETYRSLLTRHETRIRWDLWHSEATNRQGLLSLRVIRSDGQLVRFDAADHEEWTRSTAAMSGQWKTTLVETFREGREIDYGPYEPQPQVVWDIPISKWRVRDCDPSTMGMRELAPDLVEPCLHHKISVSSSCQDERILESITETAIPLWRNPIPSQWSSQGTEAIVAFLGGRRTRSKDERAHR